MFVGIVSLQRNLTNVFAEAGSCFARVYEVGQVVIADCSGS